MTPVVIPSPAGPCHAMYGVGSGPVILFCPSLGDEALRTGRIWRDFAARIGEHGFATLRFDLPGAGNSSGMPTDPCRVEAWRDAVRACASWLFPRHDGRIVLLGHRFGALLAVDAVAGGVDAERLILLDPPESGASLARHVRARARLSGSAGAGLRHGDVYIGGMPLSASTLSNVAAMPAPLREPLPALLVLDERPGKRSPWPDRLRSLGGSVDVIPFDGYDAFVGTSPFDVVPLTASFAAIIDHLERKASPSRGIAVSPPRTSRLAADECSETPIWFGPGTARLTGVDYAGVLGLGDHRPMLFPFAELARPVRDPAPDEEARALALQWLGRHASTRGSSNPVTEFAAALPGLLAEAGPDPQRINALCFNTTRQFGSAFGLLADHLAWLGENNSDAEALALSAKTLQFQLAHAARRSVVDPAIDVALRVMSVRWERCMGALGLLNAVQAK